MTILIVLGSRKALIKKLTIWHRQRNESIISPEAQENVPMNVEGNNFAMLDLQNDLSILNATNVVTSTNYTERYPEKMHACKPTRGAFTTGRSILKKNSMAGEYFMQTKPSRLSFSPFNGVKIIPNRYDLKKVSHILFSDDDESDNDGSCENSWEQ